MFAIGVVVTTFIFNLYFMNLPVEGEPVPFGAYFDGGIKNHFLGLVGGIVWCAGAITNFTAASAPPEVNISPAMSYALGQGATMISALWGLLVWKEFAGATPRVKTLLADHDSPVSDWPWEWCPWPRYSPVNRDSKRSSNLSGSPVKLPWAMFAAPPPLPPNSATIDFRLFPA